MLTQPILELSYSYFYQIIDRGFIEKFGPLGITSVIYVVSEHIKFYQNGYVTNYLFRILISLLLFILLSVEQFTMLSILFVAYLSLFKASQKY